jgi:hypothetical protein
MDMLLDGTPKEKEEAAKLRSELVAAAASLVQFWPGVKNWAARVGIFNLEQLILDLSDGPIAAEQYRAIMKAVGWAERTARLYVLDILTMAASVWRWGSDGLSDRITKSEVHLNQTQLVERSTIVNELRYRDSDVWMALSNALFTWTLSKADNMNRRQPSPIATDWAWMILMKELNELSGNQVANAHWMTTGETVSRLDSVRHHKMDKIELGVGKIRNRSINRILGIQLT